MLRHLSNTELCSHLTRERFASPLIEELCVRLLNATDSRNSFSQVANQLEAPATEKHGDCPICHAELRVEATENGKTKFIAKELP